MDDVRYAIVAKARSHIAEAIMQAMKEHELTYAELNGILLNELQGWNNQALREERGMQC